MNALVENEPVDPRGETDLRAIELDGNPHLLFAKQLNPGSLFPAVQEVWIHPLGSTVARQRKAGLQVLALGGVLLVGGFMLSRGLAVRLAQPVERLEATSAESSAGRARAEAALELTRGELQRAARFSADASHQLKTPVTVLRAGLEELMIRTPLSAEDTAYVAQLVHQTYRLSTLIDDLLLLSRMDAGRLRLDLDRVDLSGLLESCVDDLTAQAESSGVGVNSTFPPGLIILGERRYTALILENLADNARKYNRRHGRIQISAQAEAGRVRVTIGNTGAGIPPEHRSTLFQRFGRGARGEDIPGYGLGLNLARELARLHGGELELSLADEDWTEFLLTFNAAGPSSARGEVTA